MPSPRALLCAVLAVSLVFAPGAEARFGKRSTSDTSKEGAHEATAIGVEDDEDDKDDDEDSRKERRSQAAESPDGDGCCSEAGRGLAEALLGALFQAMLEGMAHAIAHGGTHQEGEPEAGLARGERGERRHAVPLSLRMGAQGLVLRGEAGGADMFLGMEGRRFGVDAHVLRLALPADDGTSGTDRLTLVEAHVSHALYVHEQARFRVEAGVSTARAPDVTLIGPSVALSIEACVLGPLDVEARAQLTPLPYRQLDGTAGLALHLGAFVLRGGWRGLFLDDMGVVDGISHQERLHGPYAGGGFTF
ncbi:hypothetical protein [Myxococcus sp. RHSTA-1-4]|uniref:hypothetical protein n=1 Tax=Myxococcus sp. RHSTA-1-4 TaxID=2874601 RepID=UPI001CBA9818|nr:hypothetical protein [Myxococcus sp. RHSTA-1-4]MBZ4416856.1 hypothetical protein [Myxococcus sp. RHSTA-1-4]